MASGVFAVGLAFFASADITSSSAAAMSASRSRACRTDGFRRFSSSGRISCRTRLRSAKSSALLASSRHRCWRAFRKATICARVASRSGRTNVAPPCLETYGMPARPVIDVPRAMRSRTVSAWSSAVWPVAMKRMFSRFAVAARKSRRTRRAAISSDSPVFFASAGTANFPRKNGAPSFSASAATNRASASAAFPRMPWCTCARAISQPSSRSASASAVESAPPLAATKTRFPRSCGKRVATVC